MSQLTLYIAASRAQPRRGESFVGLRLGGHDARPVQSPGGRPGEKTRLRRGTQPTVAPSPPRMPSPSGPFPENRIPRSSPVGA